MFRLMKEDLVSWMVVTHLDRRMVANLGCHNVV